jgi:hypothetical protein
MMRGLVDVLAGEAGIFNLHIRKVDFAIASMSGDLTTLLRRVVLVGEAALD